MKIRTKSFLKNFMTPDLQKSSKNLEMLKKFFCSKQPKKSYFTFGTTFWVDLVNFRLNNEMRS